jgi:hypothetical protein
LKQGNTRLARLLLRIAGIANVLLFFTLCCEATANGAAGVMALMLLPLSFWVVALLYATREALWFEMGKDRVFRRVCLGIGFKSEAPSWKFGLMGRLRGDTKIITPQLRDVFGTHDNWSGTVRFFDGQTLDQYNKNAPAFAMAFQVPFCQFDLHESGLIAIRAGRTQVPEAYSHPGRVMAQIPVQPVRPQQPLTKDEIPPKVIQAAEQLSQLQGYAPKQPANVWEDELSLLEGVPMARDINGRVCRIPILGQHWFIAARTNGGKGSWIWSLVLGLEPAWCINLVKFYGCDPKRLELAINSDCWEQYADTPERMVELLEHCVRDMHDRATQLQGKARKFAPTVATPLKVVVVDELGYITTMMPDKKLRARAEDAIVTLLSQGRAVGYSLVGAVQDPRKETVGFRDLFPIRIAGGLDNAEMVDLVLGKGMYEAGALCERIPRGEAGAGVAYVISETSLKPICVRSAWCSDIQIQSMLNGASLPPYQPMSQSQAVKDKNLSGQFDWNGQAWQ